jgi:hypothetical protein
MAASAKLQAPAPQPATPLERLHSEHAGLTRELAALNAASARLNETVASEAAVLREIGTMGSTEIAAMTAWASGGCVGEQPTPDQKQRRALAEKLAAAQAAATAAKGAGADLDLKISDLNDQLRAIAQQIDVAVFDQIEREHSRVIDEYAQVCKRGSELATRISGTALYFKEMGNHGRAVVIFNTKLPAITTNPHEVKGAADEWSRRAATLRTGT